MSSGKRKNGADARAKKAALLFVACERNPDPTGRLSIPNVLRVKGYSEDGALAMAEDQLATIRSELGGARLVILALRGSRSTSSTTTTTTVEGAAESPSPPGDPASGEEPLRGRIGPTGGSLLGFI